MTVAPVKTRNTKYHQKEGASAEHMPLNAVTAHATPRVLFRPAVHANWLERRALPVRTLATCRISHSEPLETAALLLKYSLLHADC